jgi:hypothetical protein
MPARAGLPTPTTRQLWIQRQLQRGCSRNCLRRRVAPQHGVGKIVAARTSDFNREQQPPSRMAQRLQYQSVESNRFQQISIMFGIRFGTRGSEVKFSLPDHFFRFGPFEDHIDRARNYTHLGEHLTTEASRSQVGAFPTLLLHDLLAEAETEFDMLVTVDTTSDTNKTSQDAHSSLWFPDHPPIDLNTSASTFRPLLWPSRRSSPGDRASRQHQLRPSMQTQTRRTQIGLACDAETNPSYYRARRYDPTGVI